MHRAEQAVNEEVETMFMRTLFIRDDDQLTSVARLKSVRAMFFSYLKNTDGRLRAMPPSAQLALSLLARTRIF